MLKFIDLFKGGRVLVELPEHKSGPVTQRRLGESLVGEGLLDAHQLDEAIEYQCIYGGKLGTSLIELGFVTEEQLARSLSLQQKLPFIKPDLLMNVPGSVLKLIPQKIALKYKIVPYHEDGKKLYVAMSESTNLSFVDELSFQLDHIIVPLAVPELRLMLALKKHYGMLLSPRFETLAAQLNRRMLAARKTSSAKQAEASQPETVAPAMQGQQELGDESAWPLLGDVDLGEEPEEETYFSAEPETKTPKTTQESPVNQHLILQRLAEASDREDIARAVIEGLKDTVGSCALLMVRGNLVNGWAASPRNSGQHLEQIEIPLAEQSVFSLAAANGFHYLGPVADSLQNRKIINYFNTNLPCTALVLPLKVRNRLVSMLYIQDSLSRLEPRFTEFKKLAEKIEMAFTLVILKNKILNT